MILAGGIPATLTGCATDADGVVCTLQEPVVHATTSATADRLRTPQSTVINAREVRSDMIHLTRHTTTLSDRWACLHRLLRRPDDRIADPVASALGGALTPGRFGASKRVVGRVRSVALLAIALGLITSTPASGSAASAAFEGTGKNPVWLVRAGTSAVAFVLWRTSCGNHQCFELQRTADGGRTFSPVSAPPIAPGRSSSGDLSDLIFANPSDGYAVTRSGIGSTDLYATFNGGGSWQREEIRADQSVEWITSTSTGFYAVVGACRNPRASCGGWGLYRTPATASDWTGRPLPFRMGDGMAPPQVAASGSNVWLTGQQQLAPYKTFLATSNDEGTIFRVAEQRTLSSVNGCGLDAASPSVLWAQCDQGNMHGDIPLSRDGGARWTASQRNLTGLFAWGVFDPVSASTAYFVNGMYPDRIYRVAAETLHTQAVGRPPNFDLGSLVFVNRQVGLALSQPIGASSEQILYRTRDGGAAWQRVLGS